MSFFALTFASFGDFTSLAQLVYSVKQTLASSSGNSKNFQELLLQLELLHVLLLQAHEAVSSSASSRSQSVQRTVTICRSLLKRIEDRTKFYRQVARKGGVFSWRKMGWMLFKEDEIIKYKSEIAAYVVMLHALVSACNNDSLQRVGSEMQVHSNRDKHDVELPYDLGYPWERGADHGCEPIRLEDAMGRRYYMPLELCTGLTALSEIMLKAFRHESWAELCREASVIFSDSNRKLVEVFGGAVRTPPSVSMYSRTMPLASGMLVRMRVPVCVQFYQEIPGPHNERYEDPDCLECDRPIWNFVDEHLSTLDKALRQQYPPDIAVLLKAHRVQRSLRHMIRIQFLTRNWRHINPYIHQSKSPSGDLIVFQLALW